MPKKTHLDAIAKSLRRFQSDSDRIDNNYKRLVAKHPNHWVAVYRGRTYIAGEYGHLYETLRKQAISIHSAAVAFLLAE